MGEEWGAPWGLCVAERRNLTVTPYRGWSSGPQTVPKIRAYGGSGVWAAAWPAGTARAKQIAPIRKTIENLRLIRAGDTEMQAELGIVSVPHFL